MKPAFAYPPGPTILMTGAPSVPRFAVDSPKREGPGADAERMTALLLQVAATADRPAFGELYAFYSPRLRAYMRKLGADGAAAEDLVQDVLAAVWNKARQFDAGKANANTWIFTIARNLRIDLIRRERRPEFDADDLELQSDEPYSPERAIITQRDAAAVRTALAALPQEQADVIRLSFFEDRPHGAIAAELGVPLGTVKSRMRLAFRRFRTALGETE